MQQLPLFNNLTASFPSTRYQGSKARLAGWIWEQIADYDFDTCLDAFGGTGAVAYRLKQEGKQVTYNDLLRFNFFFGLGLIANKSVRLSNDDITWVLSRHRELNYTNIVQENFKDIYFTEEENHWIDQTVTNIYHLEDRYKFALAFFALCQSCIIKRPYNLFHRKNLYIRLADVQRSFGNKTTWDKSFDKWFHFFAEEANLAVFDNYRENAALNMDAVEVPGDYDLVYIDPPYISKNGVPVDYRDFYHFLEGLTIYDEWEQHIDRASKHRRLKRESNPWADKNRIYDAFDRVFARFQNSIIAVSYRSDGIPGESALAHLLGKYKSRVNIVHYGQYKYVLSKNSRSGEMLLIGS